MDYLLYLFCGISVGALGTLIGAGGGFILVPVLLFAFPDIPASHITAISLFAVACNSTSGSIGYYFKRQIHFKSAFAFTIASVPGALIGARVSGVVDREVFNLIFAGLLLVLGFYLILKKGKKSVGEVNPGFAVSRTNLMLGVAISFFVGFIASFLGIGGGIIHVPLLVEVLNFPVHLAAGTSHFILAITATVASLVHYSQGELDFSQSFMVPLAIGMVLGAQIGAKYSRRVSGSLILKALGFALLIVACRLLYLTLS